MNARELRKLYFIYLYNSHEKKKKLIKAFIISIIDSYNIKSVWYIKYTNSEILYYE